MPKPKWRLATGERVYDSSPSHVHPGVHPFLDSVIAGINSRRRQTIVETVKYNQPVGHSTCVVTRPGDKIVFARRLHRRGISRFVKNRRPEPTQFVTVILRRTGKGDYQVKTAYFGLPAPSEPWGNRVKPGPRHFWRCHAFVWGVEPIVPGTESYKASGR